MSSRQKKGNCWSRLYRHIIDKSNQPIRQLSMSIGRKPSYLNAVIYNGAACGINTMSVIASACGYHLMLVGHGEVITIEEHCARFFGGDVL